MASEVRCFEVEQDDSDELVEVDADRAGELRASGKGIVRVGLADGTTHEIYGSRYLTHGIGYVLHDTGQLDVRINRATGILRSYWSPSWFEGDKHKRKPQPARVL